MNIENLKKAREHAHYTQIQAAEKLGISDGTYKNYEQGKREPNNDILINIANLFNVTTDYLLGRDQGEPSTIEKLAGEFNMSALEREIIDGYVKLPKDMREDLMEFLHKSVKKVMSESKAEESPPHIEQSEEKTITTLRYARSEDGHPPEVYETTKDFSKFPPTKSKL